MSSIIAMKADHQANKILVKIRQGVSPHDLGGKRLRPGTSSRGVIKFDLIGQYRMIVFKNEMGVECSWVGSHESYNNKIRAFIRNKRR